MMDNKDFLDTYMLVESINKYREEQRKEVVNNGNEFDENYYRCDDETKDGRGNF